ncbi:MAG: hypothetical protein H0V72_18210 [Bradyrhizobium sp.]|nr:hypothetical protein [Bradyrhizobium sp.]
MRAEPQEPQQGATAPALSDDLLEGAEAIALFLYGDAKKKRRVYHLMPHLPIFRMGNAICARKSSLLAMVETQEKGMGVGLEATKAAS